MVRRLHRLISSIPILTLLSCSTTPRQVDVPSPEEPDPDLVFAYSDGEAQYAHTTLRRMEQDIAGQTTTIHTAIRFIVTSNISPDDQGQSISFTIDSLIEVQGPGMTARPGELENMVFRGVFLSTGHLQNLADGVEPSPVVSRIVSQLRQFYPLIPAGGPEVGTSWVDTTESVTDDGSTRISNQSIIRSTAGEWNEDGSGLTISWTAEYTFSGSGEQLGQSFTLDGHGTRFGEHLLSPDGVFLQSASTDSSEASVLVPAIGITVPVVQTGVDTTRIIR